MIFEKERANPRRPGVWPILWAVILMLAVTPLCAAGATPDRQLDGGGSSGGTATAVVEDLSGSAGDPIGGERKPPKYIDPIRQFELYGVESSGGSSSSTGTLPETGEQSGLSGSRSVPWIWVLMPGAAGYMSFVLLHLMGAGGLPGVTMPGK